MRLNFQLRCTAAHVFECLTDVSRFVALHPVIEKMEPVSQGHYLVHETLHIAGFIPWTFTYPAQITHNREDRTVCIRAQVKKMVDIEMRFHIKEIPDGAMVEENVLFSSFLPVGPVMGYVFRRQHRLWFQRIEQAVFSD